MANKAYNYQEFKLSKRISVTCWTYETRYSWGHKADLYVDGQQVAHDKIVYYNRTWEAYTYQSILQSIIELGGSYISERELKACKRKIEQRPERPDSMLKTVATVAKMGEVLAGDSKKAKNDWKARMLKAGLEGRGLIMPEDWDTLSEDEKERRLDGAIKALE